MSFHTKLSALTTLLPDHVICSIVSWRGSKKSKLAHGDHIWFEGILYSHFYLSVWWESLVGGDFVLMTVAWRSLTISRSDSDTRAGIETDTWCRCQYISREKSIKNPKRTREPRQPHKNSGQKRRKKLKKRKFKTKNGSSPVWQRSLRHGRHRRRHRYTCDRTEKRSVRNSFLYLLSPSNRNIVKTCNTLVFLFKRKRIFRHHWRRVRVPVFPEQEYIWANVTGLGASAYFGELLCIVFLIIYYRF